MIERNSTPEWPVHLTKLHYLPVDIYRAVSIFRKVRREMNLRGKRTGPVDEFIIEDEIPDVVHLRNRIANPVVLFIPLILHPFCDCMGNIKRTIDPYDSEKYQRFEG